MYGGVEIQIHVFLHMTLDWGEWAASQQKKLTPPGEKF
jgi:hypothetical protein